jgi:hypothetical protein
MKDESSKMGLKKNMGPGHTTKKIRAILKLMTEFGITKYRDSEVEMEMGHAIVPPAQQSLTDQSSFDFGNYDDNALSHDDEKISEPIARDGLGFSEDDYLWRSAES